MENGSSSISAVYYADDKTSSQSPINSAPKPDLWSLPRWVLVYLGVAIVLVVSCLLWSFRTVAFHTNVAPRHRRNHTSSTPLIPRTLIFTYSYNILEQKKPKKVYANLQNTIAAYTSAWGNASDVNVWFLDNAECDEIIATVEPRLLPHFRTEAGPFKADICRACALALRGGYYFDIDVQVVQPLLLPNDVSFSTCRSEESGFANTFFQAFLAAAPNDTVVVKSIEYMLRHYNKSDHEIDCPLVGPNCLFRAHQDVNNSISPNSVKFLNEINLQNDRYPNVTRLVGGGDYCNYGVEDAATHTFHFFSRFVGSPGCPRTACDEYGCTEVVFWNDD